MKRLAALLFAFALPAYASPIDFQMTFTVNSFLVQPLLPHGPNPFHIGDQLFARFTVDNSILANDGLHAGKVTNFFSQIGLSTWDQNHPVAQLFGPPGPYSDFLGFRGPCTINTISPFCIGSPSLLLFDVLDHHVVGVQGGVFGISDFPWIDFYGTQFDSNAHYYLSQGGSREGGDLGVLGALAINQVPEPSTIALVMLVLGFMWRRRDESVRPRVRRV